LIWRKALGTAPSKTCGMKHALILAHPKADSFTAAAAATYAAACQELGHETIIRDLYRLGFDPCLKRAELPGPGTFGPGADVAAERALIGDCEVFAFFYPLWLNTPPAMLKGYMERVFGFGFAYGGEGHSYNPLLSGRKTISFSSSGAPLGWVKQIGALDALCVLFDEYFAKLCGMTALDHLHVGSMRPGASSDFVAARLNDVRKTVFQHFDDNILRISPESQPSRRLQ
jgi:NAD(P)H dehydrogenase (quinone)